MRRAALFALLAALLAGCADAPAPPAAASGRGAPDALALAAGQGRPTVIEFGANACASCREMKVVLDQLRRTHGTRIGIAEVDLVKQREAIAAYRIQLMPTQVFFDAQGREIGRNLGPIDGPSILARLGVAGG
jgi:thioredoxin 1